jgi:hypothetical protein
VNEKGNFIAKNNIGCFIKKWILWLLTSKILTL